MGINQEKLFQEFATKKFPMPEWAQEQLCRYHLVEDVCEHGVGHPNWEFIQKYDPDGESALGIHGCCGCCSSGK